MATPLADMTGRREGQIRRAIKSQIADDPAEWFRWNVTIHEQDRCTVVVIRGPRGVEDGELRAALDVYESGDLLHVPTRGRQYQTNAYLF